VQGVGIFFFIFLGGEGGVEALVQQNEVNIRAAVCVSAARRQTVVAERANDNEPGVDVKGPVVVGAVDPALPHLHRLRIEFYQIRGDPLHHEIPLVCAVGTDGDNQGEYVREGV
jgi:hypothetical protein